MDPNIQSERTTIGSAGVLENEAGLEEELKNPVSGDVGLKDGTEKTPFVRKYRTKHMKLYPELYRSDVSIHPSYTTLTNFPYYIICRHRVQRVRKQINRQLNREIVHFAMIQMLGINSVRVDRIFSIGMPPKKLIVPDFATENERRYINEMFRR